jgi:hypothetical protein
VIFNTYIAGSSRASSAMVCRNPIYMNEIKMLLFVLIALIGSLILFWILDEPEIIEDKEMR